MLDMVFFCVVEQITYCSYVLKVFFGSRLLTTPRMNLGAFGKIESNLCVMSVMGWAAAEALAGCTLMCKGAVEICVADKKGGEKQSVVPHLLSDL